MNSVEEEFQHTMNNVEAYDHELMEQDYLLYCQDYDSLMKKVWKPRT